MSAPRTTDPRGTSAAVNVPAAKSNPDDAALPHQQCPRSSQGTPPSYPPRCALYLKRVAESVYAHPETFTSLTLNLLVLDRLGLNAGKACVDRGRALRQRYASIYQRHVLAADRAVCQSQQYDLPHRGQLDSETLHKLHLIRTSWHLRAAGRQSISLGTGAADRPSRWMAATSFVRLCVRGARHRPEYLGRN